jgi:hypothetical protein
VGMWEYNGACELQSTHTFSLSLSLSLYIYICTWNPFILLMYANSKIKFKNTFFCQYCLCSRWGISELRLRKKTVYIRYFQHV